jgi:hypothetical protein
MWDNDDRERDNRRLDRGDGLLELGHETPATTVQDAVADEILSMPSHSIWPMASALTMAGIFAMLLIGHFLIALGFLAAGGLTLVGWHHKGASA